MTRGRIRFFIANSCDATSIVADCFNLVLVQPHAYARAAGNLNPLGSVSSASEAKMQRGTATFTR
jgi:hypothetical protein